MSKLNDNKNLTTNDYLTPIEDVPGVINYSSLVNLIIEQAPKGERGRLFRQDGIKLDEVTEIRIEFSKILKIDHLWVMKNLAKLTLSHNIIDKIENLDALIKLQELDLSFNRIAKMENLNHLIKLEILILTGNKINDIENIDNLINLKIFSIADNKIDEWDHVLYLRRFKYLRSINMTGNPCSKKENYNDYLVAFLPQVIYFSYVLISEQKRHSCTQMYQQAIFKVEEEEAIIKNEINRQFALEKKMADDSLCFVDQLDGDEFFELIFKYDEDGTVLKNINDETFQVFEEYKQNFSIVCHELYEFGIDQHSLRAKENEEFNSIVEKARETVRDEARQTIETVKTERNEIFKKFDSLIAQSVDNELLNEQDVKIDVKMIKAQELAKEFNESLSNMWTKLMYSQVVLHEQIEDIYEIFKINMTDLKDSFVEFVRKTFSQMREILLEYRGAINVVINNYISCIGDESVMPSHLVNICGDVDILNNTLIASHDIHIQTVDNREDSIIERINLWLEELLNNFITQENLRHRQRILEISHFLQFQREQMHNHFYINDSFALDVAAALEG